ncbi:MAG: hydroxyphenylacetyl-CoA thioesterase PaaI [Pseudomonadota bacterium]
MSVAARAAAAMWLDDHAAHALGVTIEETGDGVSKLTMPVRDDMTNGHHVIHGGFVFALADTAFAYACNSSGQRTVASQCSISFLAPAHRGDVLTAQAREIFREGRQGVTDVRVTKADGTVIAMFRGNSRTIKGSVFDNEDKH